MNLPPIKIEFDGREGFAFILAIFMLFIIFVLLLKSSPIPNELWIAESATTAFLFGSKTKDTTP